MPFMSPQELLASWGMNPRKRGGAGARSEEERLQNLLQKQKIAETKHQLALQKEQAPLKAATEKAAKEAGKEALKQAKLNEAARYQMSPFAKGALKGQVFGVGTSPFVNFGEMVAKDLELRQRKHAGAGGTLRILQKLSKGETADIADATTLGRMPKHTPESSLTDSELALMKTRDEERRKKEELRRRREMGTKGFAQWQADIEAEGK